MKLKSSPLLFILMSAALFFYASCTQNNTQLPKVGTTADTFAAPKVTILANLLDSSQPKVYLLAKMPKPFIKSNPQPPVVYSCIDSITHKPLAPEVQGRGNFTTYTAEDGLATDIVYSSLMDKKDNLWFGTCSGVSKYDGAHFTNYRIAQGLVNSNVTCIKEDKAGNLWFATSAGVSKFDGTCFTNYTPNQGLVDNFVYAIEEDKSGNIWFGTVGGVSKYDGIHFTNYTQADGLADNYIRSMAKDKKGNLWFGTQYGNVCKYDGTRFTTLTKANSLGGYGICSILEDRKGNLWFGTETRGAFKYDGTHFTAYTTAQGLANNTVMEIFEDKAGNLWFGTLHGGVSHYDGTRFTTYTTDQGLASNYVSSILEDKTGNIWFGTNGGGVSKFGGKNFTTFTNPQTLGNKTAWLISQDKTGNLWFPTNARGVTKYDGTRFTTYSVEQGLETSNIYCIKQDKKASIWLGSASGAIKFDGKKFIIYAMEQGLTSNFVGCIIEDRAENLWFGTPGGGVSKYDGRQFTNYTRVQGLADNYVSNMLEDKMGNVWFATLGGVSKYDGASFTNYTKEQGLGASQVNCIMEDKIGNIWCGTEEGGVSILIKKNDKSTNIGGHEPLFKTFTTLNGLPDNAITQITENTQGVITISTNEGIAILKNGIHAFDKEGFIEIFNSKTGYPIKNTFSIFEDSKGIRWVSTLSNKTGVVRFDYSQVTKDVRPPVVALQSIKINNEPICWNDLSPKSKNESEKPDNTLTPAYITEEVTTLGMELTAAKRDDMRLKFGDIAFENIAKWAYLPTNLVLPHQHNSITIDFNANEMSRNFMVRYQYLLEGYDNDWSPITDKTTATFGNINEGAYTFKVKAMSPEGVWCEPITYTFKVLPPWWRTWWFITFVVGCVLLALYAFYRYRTAELLKKQAELTKMVKEKTEQLLQSLDEKDALIKEIHHRVKNNLEVISSLLLLQASNMTDEKAKAALAEGQSRVQSIALIHHKLYQNNDLTTVELQSFTQDLYKQVSDVFKKPEDKVTFNMTGTGIKVDTTTAVPLGLILNELFTNAFKYAVKPHKNNLISIQLEADEAAKYKLIFRDNGNGMPSGFDLAQSKSLGMKIVKLLTKQLGGGFKYYNDKGAVFEISFATKLVA